MEGKGNVEGNQGLQLMILGSRGDHGRLGAPIFMRWPVKSRYGGGRRIVRVMGHGTRVSGRRTLDGVGGGTDWRRGVHLRVYERGARARMAGAASGSALPNVERGVGAGDDSTVPPISGSERRRQRGHGHGPLLGQLGHTWARVCAWELRCGAGPWCYTRERARTWAVWGSWAGGARLFAAAGLLYLFYFFLFF